MGRLLIRRIGTVLLTLLLVSIGVFCLADIIPGDAARAVLGPFASAAQLAHLDHELGVDRPLLFRYVHWLVQFVIGDWGRSFMYRTPVLGLVLVRLRNSAILGGFTALIVVPVSISCGILAALSRGNIADRLISIIGLSLIGIPEFVGGIFVLVLFAIKFRWFPVISRVPSLDPIDWVRQLLLPSLPLMFVLFGYISRMARAGTIEALQADYTRTAILKGLSRRRVIWRHLLPNALTPTISVVAVQLGGLIGELVVVETLFTYPGLGLLLYQSAIGHDLPVLTASILMIAVIYMLANFTADIVCAALNPRLRGEGA